MEQTEANNYLMILESKYKQTDLGGELKFPTRNWQRVIFLLFRALSYMQIADAIWKLKVWEKGKHKTCSIFWPDQRTKPWHPESWEFEKESWKAEPWILCINSVQIPGHSSVHVCEGQTRNISAEDRRGWMRTWAATATGQIMFTFSS